MGDEEVWVWEGVNKEHRGDVGDGNHICFLKEKKKEDMKRLNESTYLEQTAS